MVGHPQQIEMREDRAGFSTLSTDRFVDAGRSSRDNRCSPMLAYLSGSIEYAADFGKSWRAQITPFLRALGHEVYDPALDEKKNLEDDEVREFRGWKSSDLPRFQQTLRKIIAWDLDWIDRSDCLICYFDEAAARGAGTQGEVTYAHRRGIPVYLVLGMPADKISGWVLGCASQVFADFEQLRNAFTAGKREEVPGAEFRVPSRVAFTES
jgi:nucleoside 2-deoxyribosyltransferase